MELTVTMQKMLCAKPEGRWYFFRGTMGGDGQPESVLICKGTMPWQPREMQTLSLTGEWTVYKGQRQFQFRNARLSLPLDSRSQLHYVCLRTNGIGPAMEEKIWDLRKEDWQALEEDDIPRLPLSVLVSFRHQIELFREDSGKAETMTWLLGVGCTEAMAAAAWEAWKTGATGRVYSDCYCLAGLPGFSFRNVDEHVRGHFEIKDDDPRRIRAAALYAMQKLTDTGSTAVKCTEHLTACANLLPNLGENQIIAGVRELEDTGKLCLFRSQGMMALDRDARNERDIAVYIDDAADRPREYIGDMADDVLTAGETITPDETQLEAVRYAVSHKFSVINGGAGVGKTTVIRMIVRGLKATRPAMLVKLCAPTGKAAARLKEASGIEATTIHTMLGYMGNENFSSGDLKGEAVIIDESSMVDSALMAEVIRRDPARLILVGDQAQLTPVGKGQPFHDIIRLCPETVRTLSKCYRATEAVFRAATQIRNGNIPPRYAESEKERWVIESAPDPEEVQKIICAWAEKGELDFDKDIVLCPKNGEKTDDGFPPATVNGLNKALLQIDRNQRGTKETGKFVPGDRVINGKNNAEKHVWNGTTGTISAVFDDGELMVRLDVPHREENGREIAEVLFDREMTKNLDYAYALTDHKSQGSQYRKVVMVILARDRYMLDRSLIYTGVTRTKEACTVLGDYAAFCEGIGREKTKATVLQCLAEQEKDENENENGKDEE